MRKTSLLLVSVFGAFADRSFGMAFLAFASWLSWAPAMADDIPTFQVLGCEHNCPKIVDAALLKDSAAAFPFKYRGAEGLYAEAMVDVDYTIAVDGSVKNAFVESVLGPHEFADSALEAVNARVYSPATEDGQPVDESHRVRFVFSIKGGEKAARTSVVEDYRHAIRLAKDQKTDDAIAALNVIAAEPVLNFYERTMVGFTLAVLDEQNGLYRSARDAIRAATISEGAYLDPHVLVEALRLRIATEAQTGEFADAFAWYAILLTHITPGTDDESASIIAKLHAALDGPQPLAIDAEIVASGTQALWQHTLLRRSFEFKQVSGALDHFVLNCAHHGIQSAVSTTANWTVPPSWSSCVISVFGTPATHFQFIEFRPTAN